MAAEADGYARRVADALIAQLREGTAPWQRPWEPGQPFLPVNAVTEKPYRGMNAMWLLAAGLDRGYDDPRWMTYRQAQAADAQVRKGEKGTVIQYWKWRDDEPVRGEDGRPVLGADGRPATRAVEYARPRVFSAVVFNAAQIDGLAPVPRREPAWDRHDRAEAILVGSGAAIRHVRGDRAYYAPADDRITLPERGQFPTADRYYATALHELGHWTGHPSRLARDLAHPFGSAGYAREELRAEIASLMVGSELQIGHDVGQHAAYVESWIKALEEDPREVFRAAADAERIATMVRGFEQAREQTAGQAPERTASADAPVVGVARSGAPDPFDDALQRHIDHVLAGEVAAFAAAHGDLARGTEAYQDAVYASVLDGYVGELRERVHVHAERHLGASAAAPTEGAHAPPQPFDPFDAALRREVGDFLDATGRDVAAGPDGLTPGTGEYREAVLSWVPRRFFDPLEDRVYGIVTERLDRARAIAATRAAAPAADAPPAAHRQREERAMPTNRASATDGSAARVYLAVPYAEKDDAKALGARWDREARSWYVPPGADPAPLARWRPGEPAHTAHAASAAANPGAEFADALRDAGLRLDGEPVMDGRLRRVPVEGDKAGERSGGYVGFTDGHPAGYINNYRTGVAQTWKSQQPTASLGAADRARLAAEAAEHRQARAAARDTQAAAVAAAVHGVWDAAVPAAADHPYLAAKGVPAYGVRVSQSPALQLGPWAPDDASREKAAAGQDVQRWGGPGALLVPVRAADGTLVGAQAIDADGRKSFPRGGRLAGGFHLVGDPAAPGPLLVAEGYATAATLHEHTGAAVAVAFHAGNLEPVARALRAAYPARPIVVAADNDHRKARELGPDGRPKPNVGVEKAEAAAAAVGGVAIVPRFAPDDRGTDWNDLRQEKGTKTFARELGRALAVAERQQLVAAAPDAGREAGAATPAPPAAHNVAAERGPERVQRREARTVGDADARQTTRRAGRRHTH